MDDILNLKKAKRIAVMGGTFDPIHYGHLVAAEAVRNEFHVERVVFMPTGNPAFKLDQKVTHTEHRYLMTVLATASNPHFGVSRLEIDRDGITYTYDTLKALREICGEDTKIYFITGADAVSSILKWKSAEQVLKMCSFIAVTRPGYNKEKLRDQVAEIKGTYQSRIHFLEVPSLAISSSDIRERAAVGSPIKYLLPPEVENYIAKHHLYSRPLCPYTSGELIEMLSEDLTDKRLRHSIAVADTALKLAHYYNVDEVSCERIQLAGLLHDCTKCYSDDEMREFCASHNIPLNGVLSDIPNLAHGYSGAALAKEKYGVTDTQVLDAIRYHTFGRKGMGFIEKIICLADYIEPNRREFNGLVEIRRLAYIDLDRALLYALKSTVEYRKSQGGRIFEETLETIKWLEEFCS